ncbi:MAG: 50S ribosomal protein L29 [Chlamydiae bacterium]|nr:50S ribosomal protein L29 [Chlamydiota bacterium]
MAAKKKKKELKDESAHSLQAMATDLDREIFALRNELAWNRKLEKPHLLKEKRKQKARVLTALTLKQKSHRKEA